MTLKDDGNDGSCSRSEVKPASLGFVETSSSVAAGAMTTLRLLLFDDAFRVFFGTDCARLSECSSSFALFTRRSVVFADFGMEDIVR